MKVHFPLFFSFFYERREGERLLSNSSVEKKIIVYTYFNHQNNWNWCWWVSLSDESLIMVALNIISLKKYI